MCIRDSSNTTSRTLRVAAELLRHGIDPEEIYRVIYASNPEGRVRLVAEVLDTLIVERDVGHLILPDEVQVQASDADAGGPDGRIASRAIAPPADELERAVGMIAEAETPAIIVGHGSRFEMDPVLALAERLNCPVLTSFKAKGAVSDHHRLGCGVLGRSGTPVASYFMNEADLLVVFGASFSNHTGISDYKPIIQVDDDPMQLGRFHSVTVPVLGNAAVTAEALLASLPGSVASADRSDLIADRWRIWRAEKERRVADDRGEGVSSAAVFAALTTATPADAVIAVDVGNNAYSFGRYFECDRQAILMSGYLGSIGVGFPAAMGAWAAAPDRAVVSVTGDGGFGQYMAEITTAVKHEMPIKHVLLNNSELAKISKEQRDAHLAVWQTSLHNPDFRRFAENAGARGIRVTRREELADAFAEMYAHPGPVLVEVLVDSGLL